MKNSSKCAAKISCDSVLIVIGVFFNQQKFILISGSINQYVRLSKLDLKFPIEH